MEGGKNQPKNSADKDELAASNQARNFQKGGATQKSPISMLQLTNSTAMRND
jgi:hypothetical protein